MVDDLAIDESKLKKNAGALYESIEFSTYIMLEYRKNETQDI